MYASNNIEPIASIVHIQKQSGIPALYLVMGGAIAFAGILHIIFGPGLLCNMVGFIYPAYASYKAIEMETREDDYQWLTYWVIYASFNVIETFGDIIVIYFPFYFAIKFGLLIWLFSPSTLGADFLYKNLLKVYILDQEISPDAKSTINISQTIIQ